SHPRQLEALKRILALLLTCFWLTSSLLSSAEETSSRDQSFRQELLPLLRSYCYDCHGAQDGEGELSLGADDTAAKMVANRSDWQRALAQVRLGTMPPEDGELMSPAERRRMVELIDQLSNAVNCVQNPNAGKVALRRLTRFEYRNTVRDLTGVDYRPSLSFPGDDVGYGFDNIGDVLSLPPILMEKYLDAAEAITGQAIATAPPAEIFELEKAAVSLIGAEKYGGRDRLTLASSGTVSLQAKLPFAGMYTLTITAAGDQAGDEPVLLEVKHGRTKKKVRVPNEQPQDFDVKFRLPAGDRKLDISFVNDFYRPGQGGDRNAHLYHVKLTATQRRAPRVAEANLPESHRKLIFAEPAREQTGIPGVNRTRGEQGLTHDQATAKVMARFASRAFRRPATKNEIIRLTQLAAQVRGDGNSYEEAIQVAMQAVLVSPHFLFKVEAPQKPDPTGELPMISQYELATRISYFLWSSMPDDELLMLAHRGQLRDRSKLLDKVGRMIMDPRANRFVESFAGQWLQLRNLDQVDPDTRRFRAFNDQIRALMKKETLLFFASVMRSNLSVTTLLDADFTYLNEPLAKYYGIPNISGSKFRKVSLAGTRRGGLLTQASVLTVTSNPTRTSPVKRGKWILDNLLNTPPPPAPPNVPELDKGKLVGTLRERMEQHRENPACATCHSMMDPLGFALENFDAVGLWRNRDGKDVIDPSGKLPDGTKFTGVDELRRVLSGQRSDQFVRALAEKMMIYAVGRGAEYYDKCAIDKIVSDTREQGDRFAYLIAAIIQSDPFQKQGYRE
ncbi:MAG: DUF1592 domain-containing protein, partial [Planctomycetota bacterium]